MSLPANVLRGLEAELGVRVRRAAPVSGGCVSAAARVELSDGTALFVKAAPAGAAPDLFAEEAKSLRRLADTGVLRVPGVVAVADEWLALEWLEPAPGSADERRLGRGLALLHRVRAAACGWDSDNYIGPLPQANAEAGSWAAFWRERRLRPQLERARPRLDAGALRDFDRLLLQLDDRLAGADADGASLLHGDLWSGNVHATADGPALIDPASYYGHREVDLAMAALFGGFGPGFEAAYASEWPLADGAAVRRPIYQLYYLLVHVNLFGTGYVPSTLRALRAGLG